MLPSGRIHAMPLPRLGRGEEVGAATFRMAPRPSARTRYRTRTRAVNMARQASGVPLLASREAGLLPAPRLQRSRCRPMCVRPFVAHVWHGTPAEAT